tara:strand:+ start:900 stop:1139 length:240 start_codon:yes stop_codon:yes gene_type:complete
MKPGTVLQQYVWEEGKRVPIKVKVVEPKDPKDYDPPQTEQESPEPGLKTEQEPPEPESKVKAEPEAKIKPELPKATESK